MQKFVLYSRHLCTQPTDKRDATEAARLPASPGAVPAVLVLMSNQSHRAALVLSTFLRNQCLTYHESTYESSTIVPPCHA
jgi:hypothetical protein